MLFFVVVVVLQSGIVAEDLCSSMVFAVAFAVSALVASLVPASGATESVAAFASASASAAVVVVVLLDVVLISGIDLVLVINQSRYI